MTAILLTGFEPFRHWQMNSSWEAVAHLSARQRGLVAARLPVDHGRAATRLGELVAELRPAVLLMTGLAGAAAPRLEQIGRAGSLSPHGGPMLRRGRWPFGRSHAAVRARGIPIRLSRNAGNYVCDTTYWAALGMAVPLVAFLHLPPVGPVWTPARSSRVVEVVLKAGLEAGLG